MIHVVDHRNSALFQSLLRSMFADRKRLFVDLFGWDVPVVDVFRGVRLNRTGGQHGTDAALKALPQILGPVSGFVMSHPAHKTLYVAGDTIWNAEVERAIVRHAPDVIVLNAGMATVIGLDPIIMGPADVLAVHRAAPNAVLIASHMEAVNHCILSRTDLRAFSKRDGYEQHLLIPADGETLAI